MNAVKLFILYHCHNIIIIKYLNSNPKIFLQENCHLKDVKIYYNKVRIHDENILIFVEKKYCQESGHPTKYSPKYATGFKICNNEKNNHKYHMKTQIFGFPVGRQFEFSVLNIFFNY